MERGSFPTFFECGQIKGYKILGFQPNLVFHNSEKEKISKNDINKFIDCINVCLSGFAKNEIEDEINTPCTFVVWCSQSLPFKKFGDRLMKSNKRALGETLSGVVIVRRNFIKKYKYSREPIIGHNVAFDMNFLKSMFKREIIPFPVWHRTIDTMSLWFFLKDAGLISVTGNKLQDIATHYAVSYEGAHDALADCRITAKVYMKLLLNVSALRGKVDGTRQEEIHS